MTIWLASMAGLFLAVAQEPGGLRWPVGSGTEPYPLRATYGQLEGNFENGNDSGDLHLGLDILYRTPDTEYEIVKAVEAGTVKRVRSRSIEYSAVVIESKFVPDRAFLYLHLDRNSLEVEVGDAVSVGDPIGRIAYSNADTGEPHLHLSRLGKGFKSEAWTRLDGLSAANPLKLIKPEYLGDSQAPVVTLLDGSLQLALRENEHEDAYPIAASASTSVLRDVIVRVHDADPRSTHHLAPYEFELSMSTGSVTKVLSKLTLDGELGGTACKVLYDTTGAYTSWAPPDVIDGHRYYFVITNGGSPPSKANAWSAPPGDHVLHVTIRDVKGNSTTIDQPVHIP